MPRARDNVVMTEDQWWTRAIARLVVVGIIIAAVTGGLLHRSDDTKPATQTAGASHEQH